MRVSQRLDYTLRMLVALARMPEGSVTAAGDLAVTLGLPRRFGEQQLTALSRAGLVSSRRGTGGGCSLARPADAVTVLDVVKAVHGEALDVPHMQRSASAEYWAEVSASLEETLAATTLADLAHRQAEIDAQASPMYFI